MNNPLDERSGVDTARPDGREAVYQLRAPFSEDWKATPRPQHMRDQEDGFGAWYETTQSAYEQFHLKNKTHKGRVLYLAAQPSPQGAGQEALDARPSEP